MDVPALGSAAARLRQDQRKQAEALEAIEAVTAFLVYLTSEGRYVMDVNLDSPVTAERTPARHEVVAGCQNIADDLRRQAQTEEITMNVLGNFTRMQTDPQFHAMIASARAQAEAAAAVASGQVPQ